MSAKFKELYSFIIEKEIQSTETVKEKRGEEEVEVTKKVMKKVPLKVILKQPSRKEREEVDMVYSISYGKCIDKGCLTRQMIAKKYDDIGGFLTKDESTQYSKLYFDFYNSQTELTRLESIGVDNLSDLQKEKRKELIIDIASQKRELISFENAKDNLFQHTAEEKAKRKAMFWLLLNLTYISDPGDEKEAPYPFFEGSKDEEKEQDFEDKEDEEDQILLKIYQKIITFLVFYWEGYANSNESFEKIQKDLVKEEEAANAILEKE